MGEPSRTDKVRILIADQHPLYREGLAHASQSRDCETVGQASSGPEALQHLRKLQPDVAVISMDLQDLDGLDLLRQAKQDGLPTRIVILADPADSERLFDAILSGASVLTKMADAETLRNAIAAAARGEEIVAPELANVIGRKARQRHAPDGTLLTRRENEILNLTARGLSAQKVGQELNLASSTVKTHLAHDNAGNLTSQTHNTSTTSYGYDASNELCWRIAGTQAGSSCTAPTGATTYSFDANGNQLSSSDGRSFAYNPRNQTTDLTPAGGYDRQATYAGPDQNEMTNLDGIHFGYDKLGMALRKNTTSGSVMYYTREPDGSIINEAAAGRRASNWPPRSTTTSSSFTTPDDVTAPSGCVHPPNTKPCTPTPTRPPDSRTSTPQKQG